MADPPHWTKSGICRLPLELSVWGIVYSRFSLLSKVSDERHADRGTVGWRSQRDRLEEMTYIGLDDESESCTNVCLSLSPAHTAAGQGRSEGGARPC